MSWKIAAVLLALLVYVALMLILVGVLKVAKAADEQSEKHYSSIAASYAARTRQDKIRT